MESITSIISTTTITSITSDAGSSAMLTSGITKRALRESRHLCDVTELARTWFSCVRVCFRSSDELHRYTPHIPTHTRAHTHTHLKKKRLTIREARCRYVAAIDSIVLGRRCGHELASRDVPTRPYKTRKVVLGSTDRADLRHGVGFYGCSIGAEVLSFVLQGFP
jgi:hypothetical protein